MKSLFLICQTAEDGASYHQKRNAAYLDQNRTEYLARLPDFLSPINLVLFLFLFLLKLLEKKKRVQLKDMGEDLECLCQIMRTVGPRLDHEKAKVTAPAERSHPAPEAVPVTLRGFPLVKKKIELIISIK